MLSKQVKGNQFKTRTVSQITKNNPV